MPVSPARASAFFGPGSTGSTAPSSALSLAVFHKPGILLVCESLFLFLWTNPSQLSFLDLRKRKQAHVKICL